MLNNNDTLYWYGKIISSEKMLKDLTDNIKIVYIDKQNYKNCIDFLKNNNFICIIEGYKLTSNNDLYQYKFIRD